MTFYPSCSKFPIKTRFSRGSDSVLSCPVSISHPHAAAGTYVLCITLSFSTHRTMFNDLRVSTMPSFNHGPVDGVLYGKLYTRHTYFF